MIGVKKGFTLLETVVAIALLSMCVIGFMQALNVAMLGSDEVRQSNAAAELARSQMEYIQQRDYDCNASSIPNLYGNVSENPLSLSINTTVSNVSGMDYRAIQHIKVNVSYSRDKHHMELTDYKTPRLSSLVTSQAGWLVTENIDIPTLPATGLFSGSPCWGYYYTFETGTTTHAPGPISLMWKLRTPSWGALNGVTLYLYNESGRMGFPSGDKGLIQMLPPTAGRVTSVGSWLDVDREICAIELEDQPYGIYTAYFYNDGIAHICSILSIFSVPPSKSTITYIK